ncbi:MAG: glycosyltransferase [Vicinamibacterales bacterium]
MILFAPTLHDGGGERVIADLSLQFERLGLATPVIALLQRRVDYPHAGRIVDLGLSRRLGRAGMLLQLPLVRWRLARLIRDVRPTAVISLDLIPNLINAWTAPRPVLRVDNPVRAGQSRLGLLAQALTAARLRRRPNAVLVAVSRALASDARACFGLSDGKIRVIHNPLDLERIDRLRAQPLPDDENGRFAADGPFFLVPARLSDAKGHRHLLRAIAALRTARGDGGRWLLLGQGPLDAELRGMAEELDLAGTVRFGGWTVNPFPFMSRARAVVLPSVWEGFGMSLVEAMACGCPVIATDTAGPREIMDLDADLPLGPGVTTTAVGLIVPRPASPRALPAGSPPDASELALAGAIARVLDDPAAAAERAVRAVARARDFDVPRLRDEWAFVTAPHQ